MEGWVDLGHPAMHRPGVEPAVSRSQVQRPNHYTTEPPSSVHVTFTLQVWHGVVGPLGRWLDGTLCTSFVTLNTLAQWLLYTRAISRPSPYCHSWRSMSRVRRLNVVIPVHLSGRQFVSPRFPRSVRSTPFNWSSWIIHEIPALPSPSAHLSRRQFPPHRVDVSGGCNVRSSPYP